MPIVYKQHLDERDGTIYNCVQMPDGKWWSAENLRWAGAGVAYNNDPAMEAIYGRLYTFVEANSSCPTGSHLPSKTEWTDLASAIPDPDGTKLKANSSLWTTNTGTDNYGFAALPGGNFDYNGAFVDIRTLGLFWTSTAVGSGLSYNRSFKMLNGLSSDITNSVVSGVSAGAYAFKMSVRFIVDTFNEPIPPTKIHGTFSGSGVKVFAARPSDTTFEVPLSAQSTTELTISKDFITTFGPTIGRVRILVVDGEYISEWKDWDFRI